MFENLTTHAIYHVDHRHAPELGDVIDQVRQAENRPREADRATRIRGPREGGPDAAGGEAEVERADVADEVAVERAVDRDPDAAETGERVVELLGGAKAAQAPTTMPIAAVATRRILRTNMLMSSSTTEPTGM